MMIKSTAIVVVLMMTIAASIFSGCIQQPQQENKIQFNTGTLRLLIKDKPGDYTILHVNISLSTIQVHKAETNKTTQNQNTSSGGAFNVTTNGPYTANISEDIHFLGNASDGAEPYNYTWDFGDGNISNIQNSYYNYSTKGVYIVNLTVKDDNNMTAWAETIAYIDQEEYDNDSGWFTIVNESQTFDLLTLQNVTALLGEKNLTTGKYTQIRLTVESAIITINRSGVKEEHTLKVPSEKIKLIHPFTIVENETTVLILDFLVDKSIHETGNGKFMLKPTIKIIEG